MCKRSELSIYNGQRVAMKIGFKHSCTELDCVHVDYEIRNSKILDTANDTGIRSTTPELPDYNLCLVNGYLPRFIAVKVWKIMRMVASTGVFQPTFA